MACEVLACDCVERLYVIGYGNTLSCKPVIEIEDTGAVISLASYGPYMEIEDKPNSRGEAG